MIAISGQMWFHNAIVWLGHVSAKQCFFVALVNVLISPVPLLPVSYAKMSGTKSKITPLDIVHQNAIQVETIRKEQRNQKLYTQFSIRPHPYKKRKWFLLLL